MINKETNTMNTTTPKRQRQFKTHKHKNVDIKRCHGGYYTEGRSIESGKIFTALLAVNLSEIRTNIDKALSNGEVTAANGYFIVINDADIANAQDRINFAK